MTVYLLISVAMINGVLSVPQPYAFGTADRCLEVLQELQLAHQNNTYVCAAVKVQD